MRSQISGSELLTLRILRIWPDLRGQKSLKIELGAILSTWELRIEQIVRNLTKTAKKSKKWSFSSKSWDSGQIPKSLKSAIFSGPGKKKDVPFRIFGNRKNVTKRVELEHFCENTKVIGDFRPFFPKVVLTPAKRGTF